MSDTAVYLLGDLADVQTGPFGAQLHSSDYVSEGTPIITVEHLADGGRISHYRTPLVSEVDKVRLARYSLQLGDLVFSRVGAIDRCSYVSPGEDGWLFSGRLLRVRPDSSRVNSRFLTNFLSHESSRRWIKNHAVGSTMPCLNTSILKHVPIRLPQLSEQRKIAEILDAADESIRSTEQFIAKLEQARQGLLEDLLAYVTANIVKPTPLGDVSVIAGGVTLGRAILGFETVELPYLRVANVQDSYVDTSDMKRVRVLRTEVERYLLQAGDVLMTEGGDFDKLGRGAVWDSRVDPCLHQNHIFRVRCDTALLLPEFLAIYSASSAGRHHFVMLSKRTTNLASINMTQLKAFLVPIPPLREQSRIVDAVQAQDNDKHQERNVLSKLRSLKQGLMDDLLTGWVGVST